MAVAINPQQIVGRWNWGYALDIHTISSIHVGINQFGHDVFDTKRSELGELLYKLKYSSDLSAVDAIVEATAKFLKPSRSKFNLIVPVPPSGTRSVQPVIVLARGIGEAVNLPRCRMRYHHPLGNPVEGSHGPRKTKGIIGWALCR